MPSPTKKPRKHDLRYIRAGGIFNEVEMYCARCWHPVEHDEKDDPCPGASDPASETILIAFAVVALAAVVWFLCGFPLP